jgi:hypothetical protein
MTLYACVGNTIDIPWGYTLGKDDSIVGQSWIYRGHSDEIIALYSHGAFIPTANFRLVCGLTDTHIKLFFLYDDDDDDPVETEFHDMS